MSTSHHLLLGDRSFAAAGPQVWNVCQPSCESRTLHSDNFDEHSKCICLVTDSCSAKWQCLLCVVYKFACLLTYLLTYLLTVTDIAL